MPGQYSFPPVGKMSRTNTRDMETNELSQTLSDDETGSSGSEEGEGEDEDYEQNQILSLEKIIKWLSDMGRKVGNGYLVNLSGDVDGQREFWEENEKYCYPVNGSLPHGLEHHNDRNTGRDNLLHVIADTQNAPQSPDYDPTKLHWILDYLLDNHPGLMDEKGRNDTRVFHSAILWGNLHFINGVLNNKYADTEDFKNLLKSTVQGKDSDNTLHWAIRKIKDADIVEKLIKKAPAEAFVATTGTEKLTPLHVAVGYQNSNPSGVKVVQTLLDRGDAALDVEAADGFSVYRHHIRSVNKGKEQKQRGSEMAKTPTKRRGKSSRTKQKENTVFSAKGGGQGNSEPEPKRKAQQVNSAQDAVLKGEKSEKGDKGGEKARPSRSESNSSTPTPSSQRKSLAEATSTLPAPSGEPLTPVKENSVNVAASTEEREEQANTKRTRKSASAETPKRPSLAQHRSTASGTRKNSAPDDSFSEDEANKISKMLKLHYLRSIFDPERMKSNKSKRNIDSAVKFLYGENSEYIQLSLDLLEGGTTGGSIDVDDFMNAYQMFQYDEVLHYAAFRKLDAIGYEPEKMPDWNTAHLVGESRPTGRMDMVFFFRWLYHVKHIRNIIKVVVVDDHNDKPHSDEAIEAALKSIDVEILDWRKLDICPRAIQRACVDSSLRELHLQWSGNNIALQAWSEPDGLAKIATLERIYLYPPTKRLDSSRRVKENIEKFIERLNKARGDKPKIKVPDPLAKEIGTIRKQGQALATAQSKVVVEAHQWLEVMDRFANGLYNLEEEFKIDQFTNNPALPKELRSDIKVAVIDDGVNIVHPILIGKIVGGESFDSGYADPNLQGGKSPFQHSVTGHGTLMAYMISRICPRAKILVCKLDVFLKEGNGKQKPSFTAGSAAKAIRWAVQQDADILSMSWTIKQGERNADEMEDLRKAVTEAKKLLFCAVPDIGVTTEHDLAAYSPVGCQGATLFPVGALTADGHVSRWTGVAADGRSGLITLPGHKVMRKEEDKISEEDSTPESGSSIATALAAGYAALVTHCVRLGALYFMTRANQQPQQAAQLHQQQYGNKPTPTAEIKLLGSAPETDNSTPSIPGTAVANSANHLSFGPATPSSARSSASFPLFMAAHPSAHQNFLDANSVRKVKEYKTMDAVFKNKDKHRSEFDRIGKLISVENKSKSVSKEDKLFAIAELAMLFKNAA